MNNMKNKQLSNKYMIIGIAIIIAIILAILAVMFFLDKKQDNIISSIKDPENYSWEKYQAMSADEQAVFPDSFNSLDAYNEWHEKAYNEYKEQGKKDYTIDLEGKNAIDYSWEDYQQLSVDEKALFPDCFENIEAYHKWYNSVKPSDY